MAIRHVLEQPGLPVIPQLTLYTSSLAAYLREHGWRLNRIPLQQDTDTSDVVLYYGDTPALTFTSAVAAEFAGSVGVTTSLRIGLEASGQKNLYLDTDSIDWRYDNALLGSFTISTASVAQLVLGASSEVALDATLNGNVRLYRDNERRLETDANGAAIVAGGTAPRLSLRASDDTDLAILQVSGDTTFLDATENDSANKSFNLRTRNASGTLQTMLTADANGAVALRYSGTVRFASDSIGAKVYATGTASSPPVAADDINDARMQFADASGVTVATIGIFDGNSNFAMRSQSRGALLAFQVTDTGGTVRNAILAGAGASAPTLGFFGTAAVAKPTGVAVSAAGIHAALVTLGLIAA